MNQALHTGKIETQTSHIYIYINIMRGKNDATIVNRFTLQGFNP